MYTLWVSDVTYAIAYIRAAFGEHAISATASFYLYRSLDIKQG